MLMQYYINLTWKFLLDACSILDIFYVNHSALSYNILCYSIRAILVKYWCGNGRGP